MPLTEKANVSAATVREELAELETSYKQRSRTLKALLRALEAEEPAQASESSPKVSKKGGTDGS